MLTQRMVSFMRTKGREGARAKGRFSAFLPLPLTLSLALLLMAGCGAPPVVGGAGGIVSGAAATSSEASLAGGSGMGRVTSNRPALIRAVILDFGRTPDSSPGGLFGSGTLMVVVRLRGGGAVGSQEAYIQPK